MGEDGAKMPQDGAKIGQDGAKIAPRWGQGDAKNRRRARTLCDAGTAWAGAVDFGAPGPPSSRVILYSLRKMNQDNLRALTRLGPMARRIFF